MILASFSPPQPIWTLSRRGADRANHTSGIILSALLHLQLFSATPAYRVGDTTQSPSQPLLPSQCTKPVGDSRAPMHRTDVGAIRCQGFVHVFDLAAAPCCPKMEVAVTATGMLGAVVDDMQAKYT